MNIIKWKRPSGIPLETDDSKATIEYLESLGFTQINEGLGDQSVLILKAAKACHDANRKYCQSIGDDSQPAWTKAEEWQRESAVNGVKHLIENPGSKPEDSHNSWLAEKETAGWKHGEVKDVEKKEHPCFMPYAELPEDQKKKDEIFIATALEVLTAE